MSAVTYSRLWACKVQTHFPQEDEIRLTEHYKFTQNKLHNADNSTQFYQLQQNEPTGKLLHQGVVETAKMSIRGRPNLRNMLPLPLQSIRVQAEEGLNCARVQRIHWLTDEGNCHPEINKEEVEMLGRGRQKQNTAGYLAESRRNKVAWIKSFHW